jgi:hypothetical protein
MDFTILELFISTGLIIELLVRATNYATRPLILMLSWKLHDIFLPFKGDKKVSVKFGFASDVCCFFYGSILN